MNELLVLPNAHYYGGKGSSGTFQKIISEIPPHELFISGCLGHCAITRNKRLAKRTIGIDPSPQVIQDWQTLDLGTARTVVYCDTFINRMKQLNIEEDPEEVFIYLDPPYPLDSRKSQRLVYPHEMTDKQHEDILEYIQGLPYKVAISTYPNKMYEEALGNWRKKTFQSTTRKGLATEVLYMNYPYPDKLHDYRYYGNDYRERELIKKRRKNIKSKILKLPPIERQMLFDFLNKEFDLIKQERAL